ncbi:hypothetical protein [Tenacibaculum xiamenense]|uniref:hypothetical protein n=1 Tax=Tenacibaculum xiamenense TaxID=1261553 RepID=UPI0038945663
MKILKKWRKEAAKTKAFKLGYRYSQLSKSHREVLGNLLEDILSHSASPSVLSAFRTGEYHGSQDRRIIENNLKREIELQNNQKEEKKMDLQKMIIQLPSHSQNEQGMDIDM